MKSRAATIIVFLLGMVLVCLTAPLWADDGHGHNHGGGDVDIHTDLVSDTDVAVSNSISPSHRSQSFGFSGGLGDVDIGDCVVTRQTSIVIAAWQRHSENPWCQAMVMYQLQQYDLAERILCRDTGIAAYYDSEQECRDSVDLFSIDSELVTEEHFEEEEEYHEEQQMLYADLQSKIQNLEQEQSEEQARRRAIQRAVEQQQQDRRDYAQQALEELAEWK